MSSRSLALTDSPATPLARLADHLLLSPAQHPVPGPSCQPGLALVEALRSVFLLSGPAHVERTGWLAAVTSAYLAGDG